MTGYSPGLLLIVWSLRGELLDSAGAAVTPRLSTHRIGRRARRRRRTSPRDWPAAPAGRPRLCLAVHRRETGGSTQVGSQTATGSPPALPATQVTRDLHGRSLRTELPCDLRAIRRGRSRRFTVTRGPLTSDVRRQTSDVERNDETAGRTARGCGFNGGQGRGRTADLPILRRPLAARQPSTHIQLRPATAAGTATTTVRPLLEASSSGLWQCRVHAC
jgi:hypothetical protein